MLLSKQFAKIVLHIVKDISHIFIVFFATFLMLSKSYKYILILPDMSKKYCNITALSDFGQGLEFV